jgi:hypothetical protein
MRRICEAKNRKKLALSGSARLPLAQDGTGNRQSGALGKHEGPKESGGIDG